MLFFQIKKIISSEEWFNYVVTFLLLFDKAKNLGRSDDAKRRKIRGWPNQVLKNDNVVSFLYITK